MAVHDDLGVRESSVQLGRSGAPELIPVGDRDIEAVEFQLCHLGELRPKIKSIHVAVNRGYWSNGLQLNQDIPFPYITRVQDVLDVGEEVEYFGAEFAVGVGDDAEAHSRSDGRTVGRSGVGDHP